MSVLIQHILATSITEFLAYESLTIESEVYLSLLVDWQNTFVNCAHGVEFQAIFVCKHQILSYCVHYNNYSSKKALAKTYGSRSAQGKLL